MSLPLLQLHTGKDCIKQHSNPVHLHNTRSKVLNRLYMRLVIISAPRSFSASSPVNPRSARCSMIVSLLCWSLLFPPERKHKFTTAAVIYIACLHNIYSSQYFMDSPIPPELLPPPPPPPLPPPSPKHVGWAVGK